MIERIKGPLLTSEQTLKRIRGEMGIPPVAAPTTRLPAAKTCQGQLIFDLVGMAEMIGKELLLIEKTLEKKRDEIIKKRDKPSWKRRSYAILESEGLSEPFHSRPTTGEEDPLNLNVSIEQTNRRALKSLAKHLTPAYLHQNWNGTTGARAWTASIRRHDPSMLHGIAPSSLPPPPLPPHQLNNHHSAASSNGNRSPRNISLHRNFSVPHFNTPPMAQHSFSSNSSPCVPTRVQETIKPDQGEKVQHTTNFTIIGLQTIEKDREAADRRLMNIKG